MKITDIRCEKLEGRLPLNEDYYEERLVMPIDLYKEFRLAGWPLMENLPRGKKDLKIIGIFLYIDTDEGISGIMGPIAETPALLTQNFKNILIGQDALATQKLWDMMYRYAVHGRKGAPMMAISAIDCALWDLKGKWLGQPVYRILGGPTRSHLPAYASMLGYSVDSELVRKRTQEFKEMGYRGQKWFFRHGPASGNEGLEKNIELVKTAREAVGKDIDLMFDCWMSWDVPYTLKVAERIKNYYPKWIEEPLLPDKIERLAEIKSRSPITVAGGEHEYTRWGFYEILKNNALDIIQPDTLWAGGISEMIHICSLASVYDIPVIPHGESIAANVQIIASHPPNLCPMVEYLVKWNQGWQFFLKDPLVPRNGVIELDERAGLGIVIDEKKIQNKSNIELNI